MILRICLTISLAQFDYIIPGLKPQVLGLVPHQHEIHDQAKALPDHCVICLSYLSCAFYFKQAVQQTSVEKKKKKQTSDLPLTPGLPENDKSLNKAT